jgi:hypothetical protein
MTFLLSEKKRRSTFCIFNAEEYRVSAENRRVSSLSHFIGSKPENVEAGLHVRYEFIITSVNVSRRSLTNARDDRVLKVLRGVKKWRFAIPFIF